jgi:hypothetical protein
VRYPVITIRQFYAAQVALGLKPVENRSQPFPTKLLGQTILIHAGRGWHDHYKDGTKPEEKLQQMVIMAACQSRHMASEIGRMIEDNGGVLLRGGIIGAARITASVTDSTSPWAMRGHHHWIIEDARPTPFHYCKGRLGIWYLDYPHDVPEVSALRGKVETVRRRGNMPPPPREDKITIKPCVVL